MNNISPRNIKLFLSAAALALAVPLALAASPGGPRAGAADDCGMMDGYGMHSRHGGGMGRHAMGQHHLRHLNLSEAQRDKVFEIMHAEAPAMRERGKALHKAEAELRQLTSAPDYSEAKARALADEVGKATFEMTLARSKTERQIHDVLTPEQRKQLADLKSSAPAPKKRGDGPRSMPAEPRTPPAR